MTLVCIIPGEVKSDVCYKIKNIHVNGRSVIIQVKRIAFNFINFYASIFVKKSVLSYCC